MDKRYFDGLGARLVAAVSAKLGAAVELEKWVEHKPAGAQVPVFRVPQEKRAEAVALGLTVAAEAA